jgi:hypothetical protein
MHIIRHLPKQLIMVKPALWGRVKARKQHTIFMYFAKRVFSATAKK